MSYIPFVNRGFRKGAYSLRSAPAVGFCLHTTGSGLYHRWHRDNRVGQKVGLEELDALGQYRWGDWQKRRGHEPLPFDTAVRVYASIMDAGPTFVVCGETGRVAQGAPLNTATWHAGSSGTRRYKRKGWRSDDTDWWHQDRWKELSSPRELVGNRLWRERSANDLLIGVEVAPPSYGPLAPWSDACWESLKALVEETAAAVPTVQLDLYHLLTHSDVDPLRRTHRGHPMDPGPSQWRGHRDALSLLPAAQCLG